MRKYILIGSVVIILSVITACVGQTTNLVLKDITGIRYKDNQVHEKDFNQIEKLISQIKFQKIKMKVQDDRNILITTKDNIYHFEIGDNYRMKYTINEVSYYSKDEGHIKDLLDYLEGLPGKYESQSYYHAKIDVKYQKKKDDVFVKMETEGEHEMQVVIEAKEDIYQLRVHEIEYDKGTESYQDINLVKEAEKVKAGKQIVVKGKVSNVPMWRIEIENQYGYKTTFLPYYDETKKEVMLKREMNT